MSRPTERRSDRDLMPPPPLPPVRPRPPALFRTHGDSTTPIIVSSPESSDDEDVGSTASSTPHALTRGAGNTTIRMLDNLRSVLQGTEGAGNFCVGGRIPIGDGVGGGEFEAEEEKGVVAPITVRFDKSDGSVARAQFPPLPISNNDSGLEDLLRACSPSSPSLGFGSSRRENQGEAGSLDAKHFSTDFHPHNSGILDKIAQTLLPGFNESGRIKGKGGGDDIQRVRAELFGLQIYPSSNSPIQMELDLPLNTRQVTSSLGTLLIIVPTPHQGAQLNLSRPSQPQAQTFSITTTSLSIQYLAFSGLATLSLTPPTAGHLVTLTYNLFPSFSTDLQLQPSSSSLFIDPTSFPLYARIKHILSQPDFLPTGGPLGFFCTSNYAHTSRGAEKRFPGCLTGIDYVLFSVLKTLGFEPRVRPVLGDEAWDEYYEHQLRKFMEDDREMGEELPTQQNISRVGKGFGRIRMVDVRIAADEDPTPKVGKFFPFKEIEDVVWLNEARHEGWEVQIVNLKGAGSGDGEEQQGEEGGGLMWHYSCAAIFVEVPGFGERRELMEGGEEEEMGD